MQCKTIHKRAEREGWPLPSRVQRRLVELRTGKPPKALNNNAKEVVKGRLSKNVEDVAKTLLEKGQEANGFAFKILHGKLRSAAKNPGGIAPLETVQDVVAAVKGTRLITGEDKEGGVVNINMGDFWPTERAMEAVPQCVVVED